MRMRPGGGAFLATTLLLAARSAAALDVTAGSGAALDCAAPGVQLRAAAGAWLEPAPLATLDDYGGHQYAPRAGRNAGVAIGFAELSAGTHGYCVGVLYREELFGFASRDVLDILHADHLGAPFEAGRQYLANYRRYELEARGLRLRRVFQFEGADVQARIGLGVSLLRAVRGHEESLQGVVTATSERYATGTATWSLAGSDLDPRDFNPFVGPGDPGGWGYSTDLHVLARIRDRTQVELVVMDAYGRMQWRDLRRSDRVLDNETVRLDENANRAASIRGVDSLADEDWRIPTKYHLSLAHAVSARWKLLLADDAVRGLHFVSLGVRAGSEQRFAGAAFDLRSRAVSLDARWDFVGVSLSSDRCNWRRSSALGVSFSFARQW